MRTKALLGLAALAVGLSTSVAQNVYSLNVVGYVNVSLHAGKLSFLSLPLAPVDGNFNITNTINLADGPSGTQSSANLIPWMGNTWGSAATWYSPTDGGTGWDTSLVISNGIGFFIASQVDSTLTFVGQVPQGNFTYKLPVGLTTIGNAVPVSTNFPGANFGGNSSDNLITWDQTGQQWNSAATYYAPADGGTGWDTASVDGPMMNPGDAAFYANGGAATITFTRSFTVQ